MSDFQSISKDLNIQLIQLALQTKTEIILTPRRVHKMKGIPVRYDSDTYRVYIDTGRNIETVLLSEVGHASFPRELYHKLKEPKIFDENSETPFTDAIKQGKIKPKKGIPDS